MILYEDTRNKQDKHKQKNEYFASQGIFVIRKKLDIGDYMLDGIDNISVDTKQDLLELALDMFADKTRFERELRKAKLIGVKLYILIEQRFSKKEDLLKWKAQKDREGKRLTNVDGKAIYKKMQEHARFYDTAYRFCRKVDAGKKIIEILTQKQIKKH